ncbi:hypothetical protein DPMN_075995 [Dreissena polymorpha]|uniref:Temptin Cys/Cys disulfide domain-containing protein n=1 Tax=Dreissena polymorpha TaxID=45954 RepID=A0A9D4BQ18_DREPO|nr:hypothetical protein DPMN_075995 [Dreissena polymorpha]
MLQAFAAAGHAWTRDLCMADSDADGKTNGAELGDPTCVWVKGGVPTGVASGHPGNHCIYLLSTFTHSSTLFIGVYPFYKVCIVDIIL